MQKTIYPVLLAVFILAFASCKEQPVVINKNLASADSTYVAAPQTPQAKKVLATELTGVECPNCPSGAIMLDTLSKQNGDALVVVSLHAGTLTTPLNQTGAHSKYDFRTTDGTAILNQIFGGDPNSKPEVAFNRMKIGNAGPYFIKNYSVDWGPKLTQEVLPVENPVLINVSVKSKYNQSTGKYDIEATVAYNKSVSGNQRLNLFLTEDSIVDVQETANPLQQFDTNYVFMHVFRKAITGILGQPVLDSLSTKEAGRVYIFRTSVALAPPPNQTWVPKHMHVIAFVSQSSTNDNHVYQVAETPLTTE